MTSIGLLLPTREAVIYGDRTGDPRPLVDLAVRAEEAGFDSVWAGDSLLARPRAEPLTLLASVATATHSVKVGTAVLLPSLRTPQQLAQASATVDALSGGRLILGIGAGPGTAGVRVDHELLGMDFNRRASRTVDVAEQARALWRHGAEPQMYPLPTNPAGPPIWMGGHGPRTIERTGRMADAWFPTAISHQQYADGLGRVRSAAAEAGRSATDVMGAAYLTVVIGPADTARAELEEHSLLYYGVPHSVIETQQGSIAGPADAVHDWLRGFIEAGAEHLCIRIGSEHVDQQFEALMDLLPSLKA